MACACTHSLRIITRTTICLDVFYSALGIGKKSKQTPDALLADVEYSPLVPKNEQKKSNTMVYVCFFVAGIALNLCWNAFAFIVPYWILRYNKSIWTDFVVCYNAPGFPILVIQLFTDEFIAKRIGTRNAYIARMSFALFMIAALVGAVPFTQEGMGFNRKAMIGFTLLIGIAVGCGHGWAYSLVSYYPSKAVAYMGAGGGMSTILLIVVTLIQHYPDSESLDQLYKYFEPLFIVSILASTITIAILFTTYSKVLLSKVDHENFAIQSNDQKKHTDDEPMLKDTEPNPLDTPGPIVKYIWSPLVSIFLLLFSIVAAVALIPSIPSATNNLNFPAYILYVTSIAAFVGNEFAVYLKWVATKWNLVIFSAVRFLILPFLLIYAQYLKWHNDIFILGVLAVFGATGSFGVSKCYTLCSSSVSVNRQATASNYLNIMLYVGVYFGLAFPYVLGYFQK